MYWYMGGKKLSKINLCELATNNVVLAKQNILKNEEKARCDWRRAYTSLTIVINCPSLSRLKAVNEEYASTNENNDITLITTCKWIFGCAYKQPLIVSCAAPGSHHSKRVASPTKHSHLACGCPLSNKKKKNNNKNTPI